MCLRLCLGCGVVNLVLATSQDKEKAPLLLAHYSLDSIEVISSSLVYAFTHSLLYITTNRQVEDKEEEQQRDTYPKQQQQQRQPRRRACFHRRPLPP